MSKREPISLPVYLAADKVFEAAVAAYNEGSLQCQQPGLETTLPENRTCRYSGPCVIGVAMTPEQRKYFDTNRDGTPCSKMISLLIQEGDVETNDRNFLIKLQEAHDEAVSDAGDPEAYSRAMGELRKLLGIEQ